MELEQLAGFNLNESKIIQKESNESGFYFPKIEIEPCMEECK